MKRLRMSLMLALVLLLIAVPFASAGRNENPGILPPDSHPGGLTYGEWSAVFFQRLFGIPAPENPAVGAPTDYCYLDRIGNVGLAIPGFASFEIECEMPAGTMLYMLIVGAECSTLEPPPFYGGNEEELRACALSALPDPQLEAIIDGIEVQNVDDYLVTSPLFELTLPEDNILGLPAGTGQSVGHGAWLMLAPLSVGQHTIYVHGTVPDFDYEVTYDITVTPGH